MVVQQETSSIRVGEIMKTAPYAAAAVTGTSNRTRRQDIHRNDSKNMRSGSAIILMKGAINFIIPRIMMGGMVDLPIYRPSSNHQDGSCDPHEYERQETRSEKLDFGSLIDWDNQVSRVTAEEKVDRSEIDFPIFSAIAVI